MKHRLMWVKIFKFSLKIPVIEHFAWGINESWLSIWIEYYFIMRNEHFRSCFILSVSMSVYLGTTTKSISNFKQNCRILTTYANEYCTFIKSNVKYCLFSINLFGFSEQKNIFTFRVMSHTEKMIDISLEINYSLHVKCFDGPIEMTF